MSKQSSASKIKLNGFNDLFGLTETDNRNTEVREVMLNELHPFKNHPFKVKDDNRMAELVASIKEHGVLVPGIVRIDPRGGFEIISGHSRKKACELAGISTMPVYVRNLSDDAATIVMVDSNIQREDVLPSEKAKAYRMKYEAIKILRSRRFRLPPLAFEYYVSQAGLKFFKDDDSIIGIPFDFFLPKYRAAVEFSEQRSSSKQHRRRNNVMNDLCLKSQTKMIRILESSEDNYNNCLCISRVDDSYEGISEALQAVFGILHIEIDIDVERDIDYINRFSFASHDVV